MAGLENIESLEGEVESKEGELKEASDKFDLVNTRLGAIESSISKLSEDQEVASSLEANREAAENELAEAEAQKQKLAGELEDMLATVESLEQENYRSAGVVEELESLGEDVAASRTIIENRSSSLQDSKWRINNLLSELRR